jgi:hypothetical protein
VFLAEAIIKGVKLGGELSLSHIVKVSKKIDVHKLLPKYFHFFFNYLFSGSYRGLRIQQTPPAVPEGFKQNGKTLTQKNKQIYIL